MKQIALHLLIVLSLTLSASLVQADGKSPVKWRGWDEQNFAEAARDKKLLILDLEAIWCHWCHVMDEITYSDPKIVSLLSEKFIPIKVDQDSRPDLSTRYEDYGWPATIIFNSEGTELGKYSGYQDPKEMEEILSKALANPTKPDVRERKNSGGEAVLGDKLIEELTKRHKEIADRKLGGSYSSHKFLNPAGVELYLENSIDGQADEQEMAKLTLTGNLKLQDPVWGGAYQYSTDSDWDHPHFEKIVPTQTTNLESYALGSSIFKDPKYEAAARSLYGYLKNFLRSPEGAFYTSQDADLIKGKHSQEFFSLDDKARREKGIPAIDKHTYARENGLVIEALATYHSFVGDEDALKDAITAAQWVEANRALPNGGFRHDEKDASGPFLQDSLAMARAFLALYLETGERSWLGKARTTAQFITSTFVESGEPGLVSDVKPKGSLLKSVRNLDDNVAAARFYNSLYHFTGEDKWKNEANDILSYITKPEVAFERRSSPGIILAFKELHSNPFHITIVGSKKDPSSQMLYKSALKIPATYRRVEWYDTSEGPMPNPDVKYPDVGKPAAFLCTNKRCSLPIFKPEVLEQKAVEFRAKKG